VLALIGRNGSGKSTLIHLLLGLLKPGRGAIEWRGRNGRRRGSLGYVPQNADLVLQAARVQDELMLGARRTSATAAEARTRARHFAERLHVDAFAGEPVFSLSAGQRQRVAVAGALRDRARAAHPGRAHHRTEPRTPGSPDARSVPAVRERGASLLFATHDLRTALMHADRVVALARGRHRVRRSERRARGGGARGRSRAAAAPARGRGLGWRCAAVRSSRC
jgi:energy-coupling factor transporter ATP-binding protein EcfA2